MSKAKRYTTCPACTMWVRARSNKSPKPHNKSQGIKCPGQRPGDPGRPFNKKKGR